MAKDTRAIRSSWLSTATYDDETMNLEVVTRDGRSYTFSGVPQQVFDDFADAESPGEYYHSNIKGQYG